MVTWKKFSPLRALICLQQVLNVLTAAESAHQPTFIGLMNNVTVVRGRSASFTCKVDNLGDYKIAWTNVNDKRLLTIQDNVIAQNQGWGERLSVTKSDNATWTLHIRNVAGRHQGFYMCQVSTEPMIMQMAYLEVLISPDILSNETTSDLLVPEGESAKLFCKATGHPKPDIVWRKEDDSLITIQGPHGKELKEKMVKGEVLSLSNIARSEMGAYLCIAYNGVPPSVSKRTLVMVRFRPQIRVVNKIVEAAQGDNVTLECLSEAYPKAITYWTRDGGEMVINIRNFLVEDEILSHYGVRMKLHIRKIERRNYTGYKCVSQNSMGYAEETIRMDEIWKPNPGDQSIEESTVPAGDTPPSFTDTPILVSSSPDNNNKHEAPGLNFCLSSWVIKAFVPWCVPLSSLLA